ncbi:MAG TPA: SdrD B-like domain-containing protein, partial [Anaerolineales bacterium]|nr:SdrD B-like domain-containing protein [Anaerolineales bacterium]
MNTTFQTLKKFSTKLLAISATVLALAVPASTQLFANTAPNFVGVRGMVFLDANQDGMHQPEETGVAGVSVSAYGGHGQLLSSVITDAEGSYELALADGTRARIEVDFLPAGYDSTLFGADSRSSVNFVEITTQNLMVGLVNASANAYEFGNRAWNDVDGDGVQDPSEIAIANAHANLYEVRKENNQWVRELKGSQITDEQGLYLFNDSNVTGGLKAEQAYQVRFDEASDYEAGGALHRMVVTRRDAGSNDMHDSDAYEDDSYPTIDFVVRNGKHNDHTLDTGFVEMGPIGAFLDLNGDGIQSGDEPSLAGVTLCDGGDINGELQANTDYAICLDGVQIAVLTTDGRGNLPGANIPVVPNVPGTGQTANGGTPVKTDVTPVKTDVTPVKTDVTPVKTDVTPVKTDVTPVKTDVTPEKTEGTPVSTLTFVTSTPVTLTEDICARLLKEWQEAVGAGNQVVQDGKWQEMINYGCINPATTPAPTTIVPTQSTKTAFPTTAVPTTAVPTTAVPTTAVPTTAVPTTAVPTTAVPTTAVPTTVTPTLDPCASSTPLHTLTAITQTPATKESKTAEPAKTAAEAYGKGTEVILPPATTETPTVAPTLPPEDPCQPWDCDDILYLAETLGIENAPGTEPFDTLFAKYLAGGCFTGCGDLNGFLATYKKLGNGMMVELIESVIVANGCNTSTPCPEMTKHEQKSAQYVGKEVATANPCATATATVDPCATAVATAIVEQTLHAKYQLEQKVIAAKINGYEVTQTATPCATATATPVCNEKVQADLQAQYDNAIKNGDTATAEQILVKAKEAGCPIVTATPTVDPCGTATATATGVVEATAAVKSETMAKRLLEKAVEATATATPCATATATPVCNEKVQADLQAQYDNAIKNGDTATAEQILVKAKEAGCPIVTATPTVDPCGTATATATGVVEATAAVKSETMAKRLLEKAVEATATATPCATATATATATPICSEKLQADLQAQYDNAIKNGDTATAEQILVKAKEAGCPIVTATPTVDPCGTATATATGVVEATAAVKSETMAKRLLEKAVEATATADPCATATATATAIPACSEKVQADLQAQYDNAIANGDTATAEQILVKAKEAGCTIITATPTVNPICAELQKKYDTAVAAGDTATMQSVLDEAKKNGCVIIEATPTVNPICAELQKKYDTAVAAGDTATMQSVLDEAKKNGCVIIEATPTVNPICAEIQAAYDTAVANGDTTTMKEMIDKAAYYGCTLIEATPTVNPICAEYQASYDKSIANGDTATAEQILAKAKEAGCTIITATPTVNPICAELQKKYDNAVAAGDTATMQSVLDEAK